MQNSSLIFSPVAEYAMKENHSIGWGEAKILTANQNYCRHCSLESWYIKEMGSRINRDQGTLPYEYTRLVVKILQND